MNSVLSVFLLLFAFVLAIILIPLFSMLVFIKLGTIKVTTNTNVEKPAVISQVDREITAFHEAGHTILGKLLLKNKKFDKVEIFDTIEEGSSLGLTHFSRINYVDSFEESKNEIAFDLGGYAAEKLKFGHPYDDSSSDLDSATSLAWHIVLQKGMCDAIGSISFVDKDDNVDIFTFGNEMADKASLEIQNLLQESLQTAERTLKANEQLVDRVAEELLLKGELTEKELDLIFSQYNS